MITPRLQKQRQGPRHLEQDLDIDLEAQTRPQMLRCQLGGSGTSAKT